MIPIPTPMPLTDSAAAGASAHPHRGPGAHPRHPVLACRRPLARRGSLRDWHERRFPGQHLVGWSTGQRGPYKRRETRKPGHQVMPTGLTRVSIPQEAPGCQGVPMGQIASAGETVGPDPGLPERGPWGSPGPHLRTRGPGAGSAPSPGSGPRNQNRNRCHQPDWHLGGTYITSIRISPRTRAQVSKPVRKVD